MLLPISHNCPDPVSVNRQVSPALRDFHTVELESLGIFFCLHIIRIRIISLGINKEMEMCSQLSHGTK